jgi:hypothetical protein
MMAASIAHTIIGYRRDGTSTAFTIDNRRKLLAATNEEKFMLDLNPWIALGVMASTATTDAVYVLFNGAVNARQRIRAASWSSLWYLLSAFAVISYTRNPFYTLFAAAGSWAGAFCAVTWLKWSDPPSTLVPQGSSAPGRSH